MGCQELLQLFCNRLLKYLLSVKSLSWLPPLFSGTSTATPGVLGLSGGSCSGGGGSSIGDAPVTKTNLPRDFGPHQGGVSVPPDTVPQVGVGEFLQGSLTNDSVTRTRKFYCIIVFPEKSTRNVRLHVFDRSVQREAR